MQGGREPGRRCPWAPESLPAPGPPSHGPQTLRVGPHLGRPPQGAHPLLRPCRRFVGTGRVRTPGLRLCGAQCPVGEPQSGRVGGGAQAWPGPWSRDRGREGSVTEACSRGPTPGPGPTWACQAEAATACPGGPARAGAGAAAKCWSERAEGSGRAAWVAGPRARPLLFGAGPAAPCMVLSCSRSQGAPEWGGVGGRSSPRAAPAPRQRCRTPKSPPRSWGVRAASCPQRHPPLGLGGLQGGGASVTERTCSGGPVLAGCPAWASGSTCWRRGEVRAGLKPPLGWAARELLPGTQA